MALIKTPGFELAVYSQGDSNSGKLALVLPGKLDTKDYAHMRSHVDFLGKRGFHALSFDPPGTWESPGDIRLYTTTNYVKAINEIVEYYDKPTLLIGHSRGATMAILVGTTNPKVMGFVALMSSFTNYGFQDEKDEEWKKQGFSLSKRDLPPGGGPKVKEFKLPYSFLEDQRQYDTAEGLKKSSKPKLFILGKNDALATPEVVRKIFSLAGEPKELYELDWDHDYRLSKEKIEEVNRVVRKFLDKFNL